MCFNTCCVHTPCTVTIIELEISSAAVRLVNQYIAEAEHSALHCHGGGTGPIATVHAVYLSLMLYNCVD